MSQIRVLIVDDSVVIRQLLSKALEEDPALEVAGVAANGRIGLMKVPEVNPDVIILDVEMPEMNGLEALDALRKTDPHLPVIMYSTLTHRGAEATLDALALGASDYVAKPSGMGDLAAALGQVRAELVPRVKALGGRSSKTSSALQGPSSGPVKDKKTPVARRPSATTSSGPVGIVVIGVSTGGPNALAMLVPQLPSDLPVPVVIVQHMPAVFTKHLADRLAMQSNIPVAEASAGDVLQPGRVWIAPGDYHVELEPLIRGHRIQLHQGPPENSCRPAVDVLFRSAAKAYGAGTLAVVLTGMGKDGLLGCQQIRDAGGTILIQDQASSVVWGMPGVVSQAGLADDEMPISQIHAEIMRRVQLGRSTVRRRRGTVPSTNRRLQR